MILPELSEIWRPWFLWTSVSAWNLGRCRVLSAFVLTVVLGVGCAGEASRHARYENGEHGLHFEYPLEWTVVAEETDLDVEGDLWVSIVRLGDANTVTRPILDLISNPGPKANASTRDISAYADWRLRERVVGSVMVVSDEETTVAGLPALEMTILYQLSVGDSGELPAIAYAERVLFWEKDASYYEVSCRSVAEDVPMCDYAFDLVKRTLGFD